MAINYKDPRFQRQLLQAQAHKGRKALVDTEAITGKFAAQQQEVHNAFQRMGIRRMIAEENLRLDELGLAFSKKNFKAAMSNKEDELKFGLIGGLGTGIFAALEGRRRRKQNEELMELLK